MALLEPAHRVADPRIGVAPSRSQRRQVGRLDQPCPQRDRLGQALARRQARRHVDLWAGHRRRAARSGPARHRADLAPATQRPHQLELEQRQPQRRVGDRPVQPLQRLQRPGGRDRRAAATPGQIGEGGTGQLQLGLLRPARLREAVAQHRHVLGRGLGPLLLRQQDQHGRPPAVGRGTAGPERREAAGRIQGVGRVDRPRDRDGGIRGRARAERRQMQEQRREDAGYEAHVFRILRLPDWTDVARLRLQAR